GRGQWPSGRTRRTTPGHRESPGRCYGLCALCDTFCVRVATWLFSFRRWRRCGVRLAGSTATATGRTTAIGPVATRTTRATLFVARGGGFGRHFAVGQHVALVDPHFDADDAVSRLGFGRAVVDIGAQGVQGHTAFAIPLGTGDFDAVQATRAHDLDALGAKTHGVLHGAFHGAAELDALFELLGDGIGHQLCVGFGLADLFDVDVHRHAHQTLQIRLEVLDVLAALADHHTRTSRVNSDACILGRTLDDHAAYGRAFKLFLEVFAYADIFSQHATERFVVGVPA